MQTSDVNLEAEIRQAEIELSQADFWEYCKTLSPDFYKDSREHLRILCETLQSFYERKLLKPSGEHYTKLMIEMPPQHGKSRTLTNFCSWILGKDNTERIITASYNDDLAQDFSKYTRNIIQEESDGKNIAFQDIFDVKIKKGDGSAEKWALEGQFFNYKGCGIGGSVTGKGATIRIVDDPVKSAEEAYNEGALSKIWRWYTGTWISRRGSLEVLDIICNTPWAKLDLTGRLKDIEPEEWYVISMPVIKDGVMLCDGILDFKGYTEIKNVADENIFSANYMMERLDIKGRLYTSFKTYDKIPTDDNGNSLTTSVVSYTDTADEGDDYLCSICGEEYGEYIYLTDVIYTKDPQEITEPLMVDMLIRNNVRIATVESNNGGRGFARNVERMLHERKARCSVRWFHQSKNKRARILTEASNVQKYIMFPAGWSNMWPEFYRDLIDYQKEGKNKHDDAPDALTGLLEKGKTAIANIIRW